MLGLVSGMNFTPSPVRIAFFTDMLVEGFDGASRTMLQLIQRIPDDTFDILFVVGEFNAPIPASKVCRVPTITFPMNNDYQLALPLIVKHKIEEQLSVFAPEIIHISTPSLLGQFALKYAKKKALPVLSIYHTHFISYLDYYLKHVPWIARLLKLQLGMSQREFYNQCSLVYVPSETILRELAITGIEEKKMTIWKRGINTTIFNPGKRNRERIVAITGNNWFTVLFASRLVWEKNLETLIQVYHLFLNMGYEWNFIVAGDGIAAAALQREMPGAYFTGKIDHESLAELYASSDVFLFPSVSETYGNVVAEAMASGLPCVIADGGGSRDLIQHGISGFLCDPFDAKEYLRYMIQLQCNSTLQQQIIVAAHQAAAAFDWANLAERYCTDVLRLTHKTFMKYINESYYASLY